MLSSMPVGIAIYYEMTKEEWLSNPKTIEKSKKYYAHFDCRTDMEKVRERVTDPEWVSHHGFYPFIHYEKDCTKYNKNKGGLLKSEIFVMQHTSIGVFYSITVIY